VQCDHLAGLLAVHAPHDIAVFCALMHALPFFAPLCRRASLDTFSHVLGMDLNFHLHRKTGELLRIMDRGGRWERC